MARPLKSEELHRLQGTRPTRAQDPNAPSRHEGGRPKKPTHLSAVAAEKWDEMVRLLRKRGTLTRGDGPALELFCETWARWRACLRDIEEHGPVVEETMMSKSGEPYTRRTHNPAAKLAIQMENSIRAMLKEFAVTPASRERARPAKRKPTGQEPIII